MPTERTHLIERVPVEDHSERYPHFRLRRFCTIALTSIPLLTLIIVLFCMAIGGQTDLFGDHKTKSESLERVVYDIPHPSWPESDGMSYEQLQRTLLDTPDPAKAREWSEYYTAGPHLAGKNLSQAEWTRDLWKSFGVEQSEVVSYDTYINYPLDHRLAMLKDGEVAYEASLKEDVLPEDPTTAHPDSIPTFHGYSANGNVTAQYVFVNYGTFADFEDLREAEVDLHGKIALAKYGGVFRGLKIKRASELGMIGVVMYSDPGDDGDVREENGYKPYPSGPARQPSSVQRGSVAPGDPTTPGYPSLPGAERQPVDGAIPDIPSLPVSYADALPLLKALNGHGPKASSFNEYWQGGGLRHKGVHYNIGPSPASTTLNLYNAQEYVTTPLWNVIGIINGTIPDEVVVIGNHRDAWIVGGAGDPNSGSAAMNEVIRSMGLAMSNGWRPLRTIVFASWDGEEYGLIGSTEWVEEYVPWLRNSTVAYINVDVGARGDEFHASAAPLLNKAIYTAINLVPSPNQTTSGQSVGDVWDGRITTMGSGSDFTAFQDFAGIPSIDLGFGASSTDAVYHYHSNYDSFYWMDHFGDAKWQYHTACAQILGLLLADLVETPIINFNATDYALGLQHYLASVKTAFNSSVLASSATNDESDIFAPLDQAATALLQTSIAFDTTASHLATNLQALPPGHRNAPSAYTSVRNVNIKYKFLEREFLYQPGLDSRPWFKHVVFAPGLWTGYSGATFPGMVEAIADADREGLEKWVEISTKSLEGARTLLER
ncbi:hypothetical protein MBLNU230_g6206t1 [Neophaeotheca triangularis]